MEIATGWLVFSLLVGFLGSNRKIGFAGSFFLSILLSPLIGLIITLVSKSLTAEKYEKEVLENISTKNVTNIVDDLKKLKDLLDTDVINKESKIMNSFEPPKEESKVEIIDGVYKAPEIKTKTKVTKNSFLGLSNEIEYDIEFVDSIKGSLFDATVFDTTSNPEFYYKGINKEELAGTKEYYKDFDSCVNALHYYKTNDKLLKLNHIRTKYIALS